MKSLLVALLFAVVSMSLALEEDVIVLTDSNFDEIVNKEDIILVEFYAPWCGHCKSLAPKYAEAAGILLKNDPPIKIAKVDCTVETGVAGRFGISGYPTLKVFRNGVPSDYKGPRETAGIVSYMKKNAGPSAKPLDSVENARAFAGYPGDVSIVGFYPKGSDSSVFTKTAGALREEFRFGLITDKAVADALGISEGVTLFRAGEKDKVPFTGSGSLNDWIYEESVVVPGEITKDNQQRYLRKNLPILKLYTDVDWKSNLKQTNYYLNRLKKIAEEYKGKLLFALADKVAFADEIQKFGLATAAAVVGIDDFANSGKYRHTEEFNIPNVVKFAKDFLEGKLKSYIKSEPTPDQTGPVTIVTGENFKDIVLDNKKDVLLEMYAPWCGHCKNLAPIYDELATSLKGNDNVVIAKMDATANDSPHNKYQAKGYPTILFAKAGDKENPMPYSGTRDVKSFTEFLQKNAGTTWPKSEL